MPKTVGGAENRRRFTHPTQTRPETAPTATLPQRVDYDTNSRGDVLRIPSDDDGLLGTLGASALNVDAYLCPDCRRVLLYAPE